MIISAKYASRCPHCETCIKVGEKVEWTKGSKALHAACAAKGAAKVPSKAPARQPARQGREDCRKYGWDGVVGSDSYYSSGQYDEDS